MHKWVIVDIEEIYKYNDETNEIEFIGHNYVLACVGCGDTRTIRHDTLIKMVSYNLVSKLP